MIAALARLLPFKPPLWVLLAVAFVVGAAGSGYGVHLYYRAEIADLHTAQARAQAQTLGMAVGRIAAAARRGDELSAALATAESALTHKHQEVSDALRRNRLLTGRPCLDGGAVGVLNNAYAAPAAAVPESPGAPAATGGAAATDTDVGEWINRAWASYDICRKRLDKLIDWEEGTEHEH